MNFEKNGVLEYWNNGVLADSPIPHHSITPILNLSLNMTALN
jgi:hypothetical protein